MVYFPSIVLWKRVGPVSRNARRQKILGEALVTYGTVEEACCRQTCRRHARTAVAMRPDTAPPCTYRMSNFDTGSTGVNPRGARIPSKASARSLCQRMRNPPDYVKSISNWPSNDLGINGFKLLLHHNDTGRSKERALQTLPRGVRGTSTSFLAAAVWKRAACPCYILFKQPTATVFSLADDWQTNKEKSLQNRLSVNSGVSIVPAGADIRRSATLGLNSARSLPYRADKRDQGIRAELTRFHHISDSTKELVISEPRRETAPGSNKTVSIELISA